MTSVKSLGSSRTCAGMHAQVTRWRIVQIALFVAFVASHAARAQAPVPTALLARAESLTVGDYCVAARNAANKPAVRTALADDAALVEDQLTRICDARVAPLSLRALTGSGSASLAAVGRLRAKGLHEAMVSPLDTAMQIVRSRLRATDVRTVVRTAVGDSAAQALTVVTETANGLFVLEARDKALTRLANYERKLGPSSAKLNAVELLVNYAAQRWIPGFSPSVTRGPSPLELVASYVPTYATVQNKNFTAVSASEFGARWYLFGEQWGKDGMAGVVRPSYVSIGALVASDKSGALAWPWDGKTRTGAYVSWGAIKLGYVQGRQGALLVSRQVQMVPFVF